MRYSIVIYIFIIIFTIKNVYANNLNKLNDRLKKINSFYSLFTQKVIDEHGKIIQESKGELWIKRPNFFYWHLIKPDECILVSDGKILWLYNPIINEVTIDWLKNFIENVPLLSILDSKLKNCKYYDINQEKDIFIFLSKTKNSNIKKIIIDIDDYGSVHQFSTVECNNQMNIYKFKSIKNINIDESKFRFIPPKGASIDDQRN